MAYASIAGGRTVGQALIGLGPRGPLVVASLLVDAPPHVAFDYAAVLKDATDSEFSIAFPTLLEALGPANAPNGAIVAAMRAHPQRSREAIPEIRKLLNQPDLRHSALSALATLGDKTIVDELVESFETDPLVSTRLLEELGTGARAAAPALERIVAEGTWENRSRAARALASLRTKRSARVLEGALYSTDWRLIVEAAKALALARSASAKGVARLRQLSTVHWSWIVRRWTTWAANLLEGQPSPEPDHSYPNRHWEHPCPEKSPSTDDPAWVLPVRDPLSESLAALLPKPKIQRGSRHVFNTAQGVLIGRGWGEWGGDAHLIRSGRAVPIVAGHPIKGFAELRAGRVMMLSGLSHLGLDYGRAHEVIFTGGAIHLATVAELPGEPWMFKAAEDHLLIHSRSGRYTLSAAGEIHLIECPARTIP